LAGIVGTNPENIKQMKIGMAQDTLSNKQRNTLDKLADVLEKKSDLIFTLTQETPVVEEMQEMAFKNICTEYRLKSESPKTATDSMLIRAGWNNLDRADVNFVNYVTEKSGMPDTIANCRPDKPKCPGKRTHLQGRGVG
jgi:hypothetical protein